MTANKKQSGQRTPPTKNQHYTIDQSENLDSEYRSDTEDIMFRNQNRFKYTETGAMEMPLENEEIHFLANISDKVNKRVKGLMIGKKVIRKFSDMVSESEKYTNFYEKNKQTFEKILQMDLTGLYQNLDANAKNRDKLYKLLVKKSVFDKDELQILQGIISPKDYFKYILKNLKNRPVRDGAVNLTEDDIEALKNVQNPQMAELLNRLKRENKINDQEESCLLELGPKSAQELTEAKDYMLQVLKRYDIAGNTTYYNTWKQYNETEVKIINKFDKYIDEYNALVKGLVSEIQREFDITEQEKIKKHNICILRENTGLHIKKGKVFWGRGIKDGKIEEEKNYRIEINDIEFGGVKEDPDLHEDFRILLPTLEPMINITLTEPNGDVESLKISALQFEKWLAANQVTEKFSTESELESELGILGYIKSGTKFNYHDITKKECEEQTNWKNSYATIPLKQCSTATVQKIENGKIYLDTPIILDEGSEADNKGMRSTSEPDFGDFAKWYRKYAVVPEINEMEELEILLEQHHKKLNREMGWAENLGEPITLNKRKLPQYIISAYEPERGIMTVKSVKNGIIEIDKDYTLTPFQFYRATCKHGLTRPTLRQIEELRNAAKARKDSAAITQLNSLASQPNIPQDLPIEEETKVNSNKSPGFWDSIKAFWNNTHILNLMEIYELFLKVPKERVKDWLKDKSERRQYKVGKEFYKGFPKFGGLSSLSDIYEDRLNGKNADDIRGTEEFFEKNCSVSDVFNILYEAPNKSTLKACLQFLSKKGRLRWEDDKKLWAILNKHLGGAVYPEKFHSELGKNYPAVIGDKKVTKISSIDIFDQCQAVIDYGWGTGTYDQLSGTNEREYQNNKQSIAEKIYSKYEYRGGIKVALKKMIHNWECGLDVKESEFDGLFSEATAKLEIDLDQAIFLFVAAFSIKNPKTGQTLLSTSRLNAFMPYLQKHQIFFFFANNHEIIGENGEKIKTKFNPSMFAKIYNEVISKDIAANKQSNYEKFNVGKNTRDWIMKTILTDKVVKGKMDEKAGSPDIDVNCYQFVGPLIKKANLDRIIGKGYYSLQKPEVLKNVYAGYNQHLKVKAEMLHPDSSGKIDATRLDEFTNMVYGFVYFNNILKNRIGKTNSYMRMGQEEYDTVPQADKKAQKRSTRIYCNEIEKFIGDFADGMVILLNKMAKEVSENSEEQQNLIEHANQLAKLNIRVMRNVNTDITDNEDETYRELIRKAIETISKKDPQKFFQLISASAKNLNGMFD